MPVTLHPHLKRGLEVDDFHVDPKDVVENVPRAHCDPDEQAAKRQRIEKIASQYLQGKVPMILSAGLRGPFDNGWKNPWAKPKKAKRKSLDKETNESSHRTGASARAGARRVKPVEAKRRTRSGNRKALEEQAVASPETSRAVDNGVESFQECHTLDEIEVPAATAPSQEDHDTSGATEFFSVNTERGVKSRSPLTNPFWLRQPESREKFDMAKSTNGTTEISPTRSKSTLPQPDRRRTLQLSVPKVPVGLCAPPTKAVSPHDIRSSASASMVISSPMKPSAPIIHRTARSSEPQQRKSVPAPVKTPQLITDAPPAQAHLATTSMPTPSPVTVHKITSTKPTSQPQPVISRGEHGRSTPQQTSQDSQSKQADSGAVHTEVCSQRSQHDLVASPAPKSSTGFVYKKVGATKWTISNAPRSKPRAVNFSSSPANKKDAPTSKPNSQNMTVVEEEASKLTEEAPQLDEGVRSQLKPVQEQHSIESNQSSRHSAVSTQAAMLRAQLEFQESTFPTSPLGTLRPWSQPEEDTPRPTLAEPSPAITPLSIFRPQLEQAHSLTSVLRDPPISTQDLFAAASPFAFSTVKKKPEIPQHSNLGMSITSFDERDDPRLNDSPKSPISFSDRLPPKEKNMTPSPWGFNFENGSRNSPDSLNDNTRKSISDVELPQLDFHTSLDDYGPHGSLHFTDRLLRNLNGT
jgi:hypothetical protein